MAFAVLDHRLAQSAVRVRLGATFALENLWTVPSEQFRFYVSRPELHTGSASLNVGKRSSLRPPSSVLWFQPRNSKHPNRPKTQTRKVRTMSSSWVHFIPILTTLLAFPSLSSIYRRYRRFPIACTCCGGRSASPPTASARPLKRPRRCSGGASPMFRAWYVSGALLGGAPLAQGTVYLLLSRRVAHALTALLLTYVAVASGGGLPVADRLLRRRDASARPAACSAGSGCGCSARP